MHGKGEDEVDMEDFAEETDLQIERILINRFGHIVDRADGEPEDAPDPGSQGVSSNILEVGLPTSRSSRSETSETSAGFIMFTAATTTTKVKKAGRKPDDRAVFVPYVVGTPRDGRLRYKPAK